MDHSGRRRLMCINARGGWPVQVPAHPPPARIAGHFLEGIVNHRHRKILHTIFAHPVSANIAMKDVEGVLRALGAELGFVHAGKLHVALKGRTANLSHAKHGLPKLEVVQVRKFIETCGIDPKRDYPV